MRSRARKLPRPLGAVGSAVAAALLPAVSSCGTPAAAGGPLAITRGGTYSGAWASDDPAVAAVTVRTDEPVVVEHATVRGRGTLFAVVAEHADVTVRDTTGVGLNPGVAGRPTGRFLTAEAFDRVVVEHCAMDRTAGVYLLGGRPGATVRIWANRATDVDGRLSDGRGGWLPFNDRTSKHDGHVEHGYAVVQFLQLDKCRGVAGMDVGWNEVVNEPGASRVEDNVSVYESGGTAARPLLIHDNYVQGAYTVDPARHDGQDADWAYGWGYSGGGLMLGDGPAATVGTAASHVRATGNVVVGTSNYGIAVSAGHDIELDGNRVVSAGLLADGRRVAAQNVGVYLWDAGRRGRAAAAAATFFANGGTGNVIGWASATGGRNDSWTPDAAVWADTVHLPGPVTRAAEAAEHAGWAKRAAAAGVGVGPGGAG